MLDGLKVLFVDDDGDVLLLVKKLLANAHAEVVTASSANEALAMIDAARPDVIISDISMPGFDGYQFIESVRGRAIQTPAIALTAQTDHDRAIEAGFDAHLSKPMRATALISAISNLLASVAHDREARLDATGSAEDTSLSNFDLPLVVVD